MMTEKPRDKQPEAPEVGKSYRLANVFPTLASVDSSLLIHTLRQLYSVPSEKKDKAYRISSLGSPKLTGAFVVNVEDMGSRYSFGLVNRTLLELQRASAPKDVADVSVETQGPSNLERAFEGFEVKAQENMHGINPSQVLEYRDRKDGTRVYLCVEDSEKNPRYFLLNASTKKSWREAHKEFSK